MNAWLRVAVLLLSALAVLSMPAGCGPQKPDLGTAENPVVWSFAALGDHQEAVAGGERLAGMLAERTGLVVEASVCTDYAAVSEALGAGSAHMGWLDPFTYVLAHEKYHVDAALVGLRAGSPVYSGQIVVRADSDIDGLEDLRGKIMCWGDPNSDADSVVPRIMLRASGIDPDGDLTSKVLSGSAYDVIVAVYNGDCDAGATYSDARNLAEKDIADVKERVKVLATTAPIPNEAIAFVEGFPGQVRGRVVPALLKIAQTEEGKEALEMLYSVSGLEKADDTIYTGLLASLAKAGMRIGELTE